MKSKTELPAPVPPEIEEALFQRLLSRIQSSASAVGGGIGSAASSVGSGLGSVATAVGHGVGSAATAVGAGISSAASAVGAGATGVAEFVQEHPGIVAPAMLIPGAALPVGVAVAAMTAANIVRANISRRWQPQAGTAPEERVSFLFRCPVSLRDALGTLAAAQNRSMNELVTEAVLDLLQKYGTPYQPLGITDETPPAER